MDPSALPKNRRLRWQDPKARATPMTHDQAEAARGRLEAFINALIEASISVLTDDELAAYDGCPGLDATPVPLFRPQDRLARVRPRLHPGPPRAVLPPRPRAGLQARHGLPRRPARHPGQH